MSNEEAFLHNTSNFEANVSESPERVQSSNQHNSVLPVTKVISSKVCTVNNTIGITAHIVSNKHV